MRAGKEVMLTILGTQRIGKEKDKIEMMTGGRLLKDGNDYIIDYEESLESGMEDTHTTIRAGKNKVTITRTGSRNSQLMLEKGKRHLNHYDTGYGQLVMGINTSALENEIESKGELRVDYSIEMNHMLASINSFSLKITEVKNNDKESIVLN